MPTGFRVRDVARSPSSFQKRIRRRIAFCEMRQHLGDAVITTGTRGGTADNGVAWRRIDELGSGDLATGETASTTPGKRRIGTFVFNGLRWKCPKIDWRIVYIL